MKDFHVTLSDAETLINLQIACKIIERRR